MGIVRRGWRAATAVALVLLVSGCSMGDIRRPVPTRKAASSGPVPLASGRPPIAPDVIHEARVPVPPNHDRTDVAFADIEHGYAVFACPPRAVQARSPEPCPARLIATSDGGRSWHALRHPEPGAPSHQGLVAQQNHLLLRVERGWYVSADGGQTFIHHPVSGGPPAVIRSRFRLCCAPTQRVEAWADGRYRPVLTQPRVRGLRELAYSDGRLLAVGVHDGRPYAAISVDVGKTWRPTVVPAQDRPLANLRLELSDGDIWLLGYGADRRLFPQLWRYATDHWEPVGASGHPRLANHVVAIGGGVLAVGGPSGGGVVAGGQYIDLGWPLRVGKVRVLEDGTLFSIDSEGSIWLGRGRGTMWIKLVLSQV